MHPAEEVLQADKTEETQLLMVMRMWFQRNNKDKDDSAIAPIENGQILGGFFGGGSISSAGVHQTLASSQVPTLYNVYRATDDWCTSQHPSRMEFSVCPPT